MDEIGLEKRVQECAALGCGNLLPSQRVKLVRVFLREEQAAARARQRAGVPLAENVRKVRGPTAWEKIGKRLGVSGRTAKKEWQVWTAVQKEPRLQYLMAWMDERGVDGPWRRLQLIDAGMPVTEWNGQLRRKSALDDRYNLGIDELWYIKRNIERMVDEVEWLMRQQPVDQHEAFLCLLGRIFRMLWAERQERTPEQLQAAFARFLDWQPAEERRVPRPRRTIPHRFGPGGLTISPWPPEDPRGGYGGSVADLERLLPSLAQWVPKKVGDKLRSGVSP